VDITDTYQNNLFEIESKKQEETNKAYGEYLSYVTAIQNDREMTEDERFDAIQTAQASYKKNIAQINQDSFEARFNVSQTSAQQVRDLKFRQVDKDVSLVMGFAADKNGNAILDEYGQKIDIPEEAQDPVNKQFVPAQYDSYGRLLSPAGSFDPSTGEFVADTSFSVPSTLAQSGGVNWASGEVKSYLEDLFDVGSVGGWCGEYASTISDAPKVGDTWAEKSSAITKRDNPKAGDKMVIPVGVTDANKSYGHVVTVLDYNAATGDIYVVESNRDGRQNQGNGEGVVTLGTYNFGELQDKYGQNFGFVEGNLREPYASAINGISMSFGTSMYSGGTNLSMADLDAESDQLGLTGTTKAKYMQARAKGEDIDTALETATTEDATSSVLSPSDVRKYDKEVRTSDEYKSIAKSRDAYRALQNLSTLLKANNDEKDLFGADSGALSTAYQNALLRMKEFYNLGALTGPDVEAMERIMPDPTSFAAGALKGGGAATRAGLNQLMADLSNSVQSRADTLYSSYGDYRDQLGVFNSLDSILSEVAPESSASTEGNQTLTLGDLPQEYQDLINSGDITFEQALQDFNSQQNG
jgi:hypothetical protein